MKQCIKKIIIHLMTIVCFFMSCPFYVYASEHGGSGGSDHNSNFITDAGTINIEDDGVVMYYIEYILSNIGAIFVDHDITKAMANDQTMKEYIAKGKYDANEKTVTFPKETIIYIMQCIEEYAKTEQTKEENGGFYLMPTINYEDVTMDVFNNSYMYYTFRNLVREKGVLSFRLRTGDVRFVDPFSDPDHPILLVGDISYLNSYLKNPENTVYTTYFCANDWLSEKYPIMKFEDTEKIHYSCAEAVQYNTGSAGYSAGAHVNAIDTYNFTLYSTTGERVRVFVSSYAAKNYSVGNRKIYFSENYYNYVPEDLTVSIDDLTKSVDDLQKIIDDLLEKIGNDTSEKEIEELLRQILEELRKNPGTGSGSGGGDVTVSVDLKETNSWLSKIYTRLGDILSTISESAENAGQNALEGIQSKLDEIAKTLKSIKGWTIADTVADAADAVADWLDFIKDMFTDVDSGVSAISSTMGDAANLMKTKFPFCIPWDVYYLLDFLAEEPQTPVFKLPIKLESYGIEEYIEVDMERFSVLSTLSRTILTVIYCYALLNLTMKIFPLAKEET